MASKLKTTEEELREWLQSTQAQRDQYQAEVQLLRYQLDMIRQVVSRNFQQGHLP